MGLKLSSWEARSVNVPKAFWPPVPTAALLIHPFQEEHRKIVNSLREPLHVHLCKIPPVLLLEWSLITGLPWLLSMSRKTSGFQGRKGAMVPLLRELCRHTSILRGLNTEIIGNGNGLSLIKYLPGLLCQWFLSSGPIFTSLDAQLLLLNCCWFKSETDINQGLQEYRYLSVSSIPQEGKDWEGLTRHMSSFENYDITAIRWWFGIYGDRG